MLETVSERPERKEFMRDIRLRSFDRERYSALDEAIHALNEERARYREALDSTVAQRADDPIAEPLWSLAVAGG